MSRGYEPFSKLAAELEPLSPLRAAVSQAKHAPEPSTVAALLDAARLPPGVNQATVVLARDLASTIRGALGKQGLVQGLMQEFALSTEEGVSLMCVAEALLRIPDAANAGRAHPRQAAGAGLGIAPRPQRLCFHQCCRVGPLPHRQAHDDTQRGGSGECTHPRARAHGAPLLRRGVELTMRLMAEQFISGETIEEALDNAREREAQGFRYSYDMLGESALTADDAQAYYERYMHAIDAIGRASAGRGIYSGPGISIKLSALHPRYTRSQRERVLRELYPRLVCLVEAARRHDIGVNVDAEEVDRLDLSLDLLERLCHEPQLTGWHGIGFVVQAYQKRATVVIDYLIDLAQRTRRRLMIRLVKGAYWDSEVKRAQYEGVADYPVFTRK